MSFRRRMVVLAAGAVAAAVVIASVVVYVVTRNELRAQLDASLRQKLTPGQPQAVQVKSNPLSEAQLRREEAGLARAFSALGAVPSSSPVPSAGSASGSSVVGGGGSPNGGPIVSSQSLEGKDLLVLRGTAASRPGNSIAPLAGVPVGPVPGLSLLGSGPAILSTSAATPAPGTRGGATRTTTVKVVLPTQTLGGATGYAQLVQPNGQVLRSSGAGPGLPVSNATRAVAAGKLGTFFSDATVAGTPVRILTERAALGEGVWQVALPLSDVNSTLGQLELVLAAVSLGGIALAAILGLLVSRAALVPVRRLTGAAERVARTQDLGHRIDAGEQDELGRLAVSFNTMLAALERSRLAQRQLVSDASHELRTPLTSIRANLDVLASGSSLPERDRARVIDAARAQLAELTVLVGDLVDLSKTGIDAVELEDVRLDLAAEGAMERARLHAPQCRFVLDAQPCLVRAAPARLDRAIANLLDNAAKWGPSGGPVEVRVRDGYLRVRDHGPGISAADLPNVFDRFYRAPAARGLPGSGLGLAIVRQVAETHGGSVSADSDPGGGAALELRLPALELTAADCAAPGAVQQVPPIL
jgi:two-component system sensor histidine kinase MprB